MRLDEILQAAQIEFRDIAVGMHDESRLISQLSMAQEKEIIGLIEKIFAAIAFINFFDRTKLNECL